MLERVNELCGIIKDNDKLMYQWKEYTNKQQKVYLNYWSPLSFIKNRYVSGVLRRFGIGFYNKKGMSLFLNLLRCEAHNNLFGH